MIRFLLVCLGGAAGSGARYLVSLGMAALFGNVFPVGTLLVNVIGSLLIAFILEFAAATNSLSPDLRLMLTTGVLGGFTTYSAFNYEATQFVRDGALRMAALYVGATLVLCFAAGFAGLALARVVASR